MRALARRRAVPSLPLPSLSRRRCQQLLLQSSFLPMPRTICGRRHAAPSSCMRGGAGRQREACVRAVDRWEPACRKLVQAEHQSRQRTHADDRERQRDVAGGDHVGGAACVQQ